MPLSAWCSECGRWVWVTPDGRCQEGHAAASLSGHRDAPSVEDGVPSSSSARPRWLLIIAGVIVSLIVLGSAVALITSGAEVVADRAAERRTQEAMDRFVAEQYPGYDVVQQQPLFDTGPRYRGGMYVVRSREYPDLRIAVELWEVPEEHDYLQPADGEVRVGDLIMDDGVFSADRLQHGGVSADEIDDVIASYVEGVPSGTAIANFASYVNGSVSMNVTVDPAWEGEVYRYPLVATHWATIARHKGEGLDGTRAEWGPAKFERYDD